MESMPKKWVLQSLSPNLDVKDLRSLSDGAEQTGVDITVVRSQPSVTVTSTPRDSPRDVFVQANRVAVSDEGSSGEDWRGSSPSSPGGSSSSDSHSGFYSFVERSLSPEAEKTAVWMSSPDREAKLAVLKEENGYKLRAYTEEKRPEKLFEETNGDSRYRTEDVGDTEQEEEEQIQERLEIIHSQAPKISPDFKEQWSALESLDHNYSPQRLLEGLSLTYSSPRTEVQQTKAEPGTIDTEQISFTAARQQFMKMEQTKRNPFQQLLQSPKHQERPSQSEVIVMSREVNEDDLPKEQLSQSLRSDPIKDQVFTAKTVIVSITEESGTKRQSSSFDDLDSGLGDFSLDPKGGYASDGGASSEALGAETGDGPSSTRTAETPIEREIRIMQEREESLRRERGIKRTDVREMVEIKTKPSLSQASPTLTPVRTKDRNRVSFLIQRDIRKDSQREEDHQGKVPGLYDPGTAQELGERKRLFELHEDQIPVMPNQEEPHGEHSDCQAGQTRP
ncbi:hypothetical protein AAFF_G00258100 [Aldrovandia affinis]|uniref:A-kinase anchor protein 2 C-terminal domain-containing protein n=1 Tax=Aldrovandia affinis TaxID=143900 RepID=A0AAD7SV48_9TELE|nr:hypothetical protein AAFF_G00258100 [Aldrovandia affinis]